MKLIEMMNIKTLEFLKHQYRNSLHKFEFKRCKCNEYLTVFAIKHLLCHLPVLFESSKYISFMCLCHLYTHIVNVNYINRILRGIKQWYVCCHPMRCNKYDKMYRRSFLFQDKDEAEGISTFNRKVQHFCFLSV